MTGLGGLTATPVSLAMRVKTGRRTRRLAGLSFSIRGGVRRAVAGVNGVLGSYMILPCMCANAACGRRRKGGDSPLGGDSDDTGSAAAASFGLVASTGRPTRWQNRCSDRFREMGMGDDTRGAVTEEEERE